MYGSISDKCALADSDEDGQVESYPEYWSIGQTTDRVHVQSAEIGRSMALAVGDFVHFRTDLAFDSL